jgi:hypothetical protein
MLLDTHTGVTLQKRKLTLMCTENNEDLRYVTCSVTDTHTGVTLQKWKLILMCTENNEDLRYVTCSVTYET